MNEAYLQQVSPPPTPAPHPGAGRGRARPGPAADAGPARRHRPLARAERAAAAWRAERVADQLASRDDLRHTAGSLRLADGAQITDVSKILGHSYAESQRKAVAGVGRLLGRGEQPNRSNAPLPPQWERGWG